MISGFVLRGRHLFVYDILAVLLAIVGAFALRFDATDVARHLQPYLPVVLMPLVVRPVTNIAFGLYRREWRYASIRELIMVCAAVGTGTVVMAGTFIVLAEFAVPGTIGMPRSFFALEGLLSLVLIGGGRFAIRLLLEAGGRSWPSEDAQARRTIIYGAGEGGAQLSRLAGADRAAQMTIVGFLDDDAGKRGSRLLGRRIYGGLDALEEVVRSTGAVQLVVAMPSAPGGVIRQVVERARTAGLEVKIMPPLSEFLDGAGRLGKLRSVRLEDLLRREPVTTDLDLISDYLNGTSVLITGGGGSIGAELARQILAFGPRRVTIVDHSEIAIWAIEQELRERAAAAGQQFLTALADVRSPVALKRVFGEAEPDVVFHAAALKHVPVCELHPAEAALTNVTGTRNVLQAAEAGGVQRMVLISTDKAVKPVSIMGATKRIAELLALQSAERTGRHCLAVRFGNVLGSSGSVVPVFQRQLEHGLPITITHPDATRYFMTIPEAVSLILEAGGDESTAGIFVLDMGDPVRITDLAADVIRLSGADPASVPIHFIGLRPGERLHETLFYDHEATEPTAHPRVLRATGESGVLSDAALDRLVGRLEAAAEDRNERAVRACLVEAGILHVPMPAHASEPTNLAV